MTLLLFTLLLTTVKYAEATSITYTLTSPDFTTADGTYFTTSENVTASFTYDFGPGAFSYACNYENAHPPGSSPLPFTMTVGSTTLTSTSDFGITFNVAGTGPTITSWDIELSTNNLITPTDYTTTYFVTKSPPDATGLYATALIEETLITPSEIFFSVPGYGYGVVEQVPEPTTLILVATGLGGLAVIGRRKRS